MWAARVTNAELIVITLNDDRLVTTSRCLPSCLVADSILGNIEKESDPALDAVKCSFLSFLFEMCWDTNPGSDCRPSVDKRIRSMASFYRNTCLHNSCFALFSLSSASENTVRAKCAPHFDSLLATLMKPDCTDDIQSQIGHLDRQRKIENFKECAQKQARTSCKNETLQFLDTFANHMTEICPPRSASHINEVGNHTVAA